jgi:hypothetical protein
MGSHAIPVRNELALFHLRGPKETLSLEPTRLNLGRWCSRKPMRLFRELTGKVLECLVKRHRAPTFHTRIVAQPDQSVKQIRIILFWVIEENLERSDVGMVLW